MRARGRLRIVHGRNWYARLIARALRMPRAGDAVETELVVMRDESGERWMRIFASQRLDSRQYPVGDGDVAERFGAIEFRFHLEGSGATTSYRQVGVALVAGPIRVPLPRVCAPVVTAREDVTGPGTRHIDVRLDLPIVGPILSYAGTIVLDEVVS